MKSGSMLKLGRTALFAALAVLIPTSPVLPSEAVGGPSGPARFGIRTSDMHLSRTARPGTYFDKTGRRFAMLGTESGSFEAWAYPLKLFRDFEFSFLLGSSTTPIKGRDIVRFVDVEPEATTLTYTWQSFTVKAHYIADPEEAGGIILLEVDSTEPLTVICGFLPVLQPMWPAGLGGQYAYWDADLKAYLISEPTRRNHGYVGSPAAEGISYTPAHMLSDNPNEFKIEVREPAKVRSLFLPIVMAGGKGDREAVKAVYRKLAADPRGCYERAKEHFTSLRASTLHVETPDRDLNLAFEWAKTALDGLFVDNPDLGRGLVAGLGASGSGGRPGFGWFFGGDAFLNSFSLNSLGLTGMTREAIAFNLKWQRKDGKMAHELSQGAGYIKWWDDYPYGYIHGDTTPYFLVAVGDYYRATGDAAFVKQVWPALMKAYKWCLATDEDGDGLMDNGKAGLGALEFGSLTGINTDIYVAAVWAKANQAMVELAGVAGDKATASEAARVFERAARAWNEKFWDRNAGRYSYAFDKQGRLVAELTPWSAVGLAWGLGDPERGTMTMAAMNSPELTTDWGVRMMSRQSPYYEPLNYNYGACWPFLTGWVADSLFKLGFIGQGTVILNATAAHTFDNDLGAVTELFSGDQDVWPNEGVPHQGFSTTGFVLPLLRGLLGLDADVPGRIVRIEPAVPAGWPGFNISGWKVGAAQLTAAYGRTRDMVRLRLDSTGAAGFKAVFAPALATGTVVRAVRVNGRPADFKAAEFPFSQSVRLEIMFPISGSDTVEIDIRPGLEIIAPAPAVRTGDASRGVRLIRTRRDGDWVTVSVAGPSGSRAELALAYPDAAAEVKGAELKGGKLVISFPDGGQDGYSALDIRVRMK